MKLLAALLALFGVSGQSTDRPAYAAGQVWEYRTRPTEPDSLLRIQAIEADPRGDPIYHISLIGLALPGGEIMHSPVSKQTLDASVTRLSSRRPAFPDPSEGIAIWRENEGGVFTLSVAEIVEAIESISTRGRPESE
ncbi:hypothetical protein ACCC88_20715 [Sphingomonas sp. Sphisp140]|uniref:hypothetical protein n=1 Tax=unclassified Sphingomonas TaxID=196159 RepID=UPI0039AFBB0F